MKRSQRWMALAACAAVVACGALPAAAAESADGGMVYRTSSVYQSMKTGGVGGSMVVTGLNNGAFCMGTMTDDGETAWQAYDAKLYPTLFGEKEWTVSSSVSCESRCPYYAEHQSNTVCSWQMIYQETLRQASTGKTFGPYYVVKPLSISAGSVILCPSGDDFVSPENLRWNADNGDWLCVKGQNGLWGVYRASTDTMTVPCQYTDIRTVEASGRIKAKSDGHWGAIEASTGATTTPFVYAYDDLFSATEELRRVDAMGHYAVFNEDNEQISTVRFTPGAQEYAYDAHNHLVRMQQGNVTRFYDLNGKERYVTDADHTIEYVQGEVYALRYYATVNGQRQFKNMALVSFEGQPQPNDTVLTGDANLDGVVTSTDAHDTLLAATGYLQLTPRQRAAADMDGSGELNARDARLMLLSAVGATQEIAAAL